MTPVSEFVNILHLTDLHFRRDDTGADRTGRTLAIQTFFERLDQIRNENVDRVAAGDSVEDWTPRLVAVSGDLAYSGSTEDYAQAAEFLDRLVKELGLGLGDVIVCPGNHDRNQKRTYGLSYPLSAEEADRWLDPQALVGAPLVNPFHDFASFCEKTGLIRASGLPGLEYLTGVARKDLPEQDARLDFLVMNSAWFARPGGGDIRNLWMGLPLLEQLHATGLIHQNRPPGGLPGNHGRHVRIALMHHPREWFNEEEHDSYSDRPNTYRYLADCSDIILHGHVHAALEPPSLAYSSAQTFTGGATYSNGRYRNNFSLLQLNFDDTSVRRRGFEYDPRVKQWAENLNAAGVHLLHSQALDYQIQRGPTDLSGAWSTVFWAEAATDLRKPVHTIRFEPANGVPNGFRGRSDAPWHYDIQGELADGMFSGTWRAEDTDKVRDGVFQFRVAPGGNVMSGRWLGYDRHNDIRVGRWKFSRK